MAKKKIKLPAPLPLEFPFYPLGSSETLENKILYSTKAITEKFMKSKYYPLSLKTKYLSARMYLIDFIQSELLICPETGTSGKLIEAVKIEIENKINNVKPKT